MRFTQFDFGSLPTCPPSKQPNIQAPSTAHGRLTVVRIGALSAKSKARNNNQKREKGAGKWEKADGKSRRETQPLNPEAP